MNEQNFSLEAKNEENNISDRFLSIVILSSNRHIKLHQHITTFYALHIYSQKSEKIDLVQEDVLPASGPSGNWFSLGGVVVFVDFGLSGLFVSVYSLRFAC